MEDFLTEPVDHQEAIDFINSKPIVSRDVFNRLLPELRGRAFVVSGIECASVLASLRATLAELPAGGDWNKLKERLYDDLESHFVDPAETPEVQAAQRRAANRRAELLLRTHGQQAYAAAAYRVADEPEMRALFPYWQYQTLGDGRVRDTHAALDGVALPNNHPFWLTHLPPWQWGCRCQFITLSELDVAELREADQALPYERQRVLDQPALDKLEKENTIIRPANPRTGQGHPTPFNVAAPRDKADGSGYHWHPGDLRLAPADLKARYDAQTWSEFSKWARNTVLPGQNQTVWEWMSAAPVAGGPSPIAPRPATEAAPAAEGAPTAPITPPAPIVVPPAPTPAPAPQPRPAPKPKWKPRVLTEEEIARMLAVLGPAKSEAHQPVAGGIPIPIAPEHAAAAAHFAAVNERERDAIGRLNAMIAIHQKEHPDGQMSEDVAAWAARQREAIRGLFAAQRQNLPPSAPAVAAAPATPAAPETIDALFARLKLTNAKPWSKADVAAVLAALKKKDAVQARDKVKQVTGDALQPSGMFSEAGIHAEIQKVLDLLPRHIAEALPKLSVNIRQKIGGILGEYGPAKNTLDLNFESLTRHGEALARETIAHEVMHWVHLKGPATYRTAIRQHFRARTKGEKTKKLPYMPSRARKDHFYDPYAGVIYGHENGPDGEGLEIPTTYIELLANPDKMVLHTNPANNANAPHVVETLKVVLGIFQDPAAK